MRGYNEWKYGGDGRLNVSSLSYMESEKNEEAILAEKPKMIVTPFTYDDYKIEEDKLYKLSVDSETYHLIEKLELAYDAFSKSYPKYIEYSKSHESYDYMKFLSENREYISDYVEYNTCLKILSQRKIKHKLVSDHEKELKEIGKL